MDEKKQNKTGIMILLAMVAAMGFLAATEGWLRVSECGEVLPGELPPSAAEETGDWDTGSVNEYPGIIRFHVIANSDKQEDQQIKYMVRDEVFRKLENALTRKLLQEEARGRVAWHRPKSAARISESICRKLRPGRGNVCARAGAPIRQVRDTASARFWPKTMMTSISPQGIMRR